MSTADADRDAARVLAGVLAAQELGADDVAAETLADVLGAEIGLSSRWMPGPLTGADAVGSYLSEAMRPVARWTPPSDDLVAAVSSTLGAAGGGLLANPDPGWGRPILRLSVGGLDDAAALRRMGPVDGICLVPHVRRGAHRISWRWPVRVGVLDGPAAAEQVRQLNGGLTHLFTVTVVHGWMAPVELEILVLPDAVAASDLPDGVWAACVLVPGGGGGEVIGRVDRRDPAAIVVTELADLSWFPGLIAELAHDQPLDVAVTLACPGDVSIVADHTFLALTALRVWGLRWAEGLDRLDPATLIGGSHVEALVEEVRSLVADGSFDSEQRGATGLADHARRVVDAGLSETTTVRERVAMPEAPPPDGGDDRAGGDDGGAGGAPGPPGGDGDAAFEAPEVPPVEPDRGVVSGGGGAEAETPPPDSRRVQTQFVDPVTKKPVPDRFVAGTVHHLRVRIAAELAQEAVGADAPFVNPTPGRQADLQVEVIAGETHARRKLSLPAVGDSKWTKVVPFEVPAAAQEFAVIVQIWFAGRVVQSLVLSGPVVAAGAAAGDAAGDGGLWLSVDASTPAAEVHDMSPAAASLTIAPGLEGEPRLFDLAQTNLITSAGLARAVAEVRSALLAAFLDSPGSLAGAAGVLTELALSGRDLYLQLQAVNYDDAEWIHVSTFGGADLPVELVYTHLAPDAADVPVCPTALAGALECAADCPDRSRSDCVCPFGFWATSKVIERRAHTGGRTSPTAGAQRAVPILTVGAAGVSVKADEVDPTSSARILAAVESAVAAGGFHRVSTWADLKPLAQLPAQLLVLITHTIPGDTPQLQLGSDILGLRFIDTKHVNLGTPTVPGPVVLAIGCDTEALEAGFSDYPGRLIGAGAEIVVTAISPVPGKTVADFVVRFFEALPAYLATPGVHRFGEVLTAIRQRTIATGDVLALALTAAGDADVALVGT